MKGISKATITLLIAVTLVFGVAVASFAWLSININKDFNNNYHGSTEVAYFESGDGSLSNPYVISNRVHLYNFAWLQYLGYFNLNEKYDKKFNNGRAQSYFVLKNDINMEGLAIPPIGTTEFPFFGNFNGNGNQIYNATTANDKALLTARPKLAEFTDGADGKIISWPDYAHNNATQTQVGEAMGLFGVVGDYNDKLNEIGNKQGVTISADAPPTSESGAAVEENKKILYKQANTIQSFYLNDYTVHSSTDKMLVGIVAGYVNAKVSDVGVCAATITSTGTSVLDGGVTDKLSDFAIVGYCADEYKGVFNVSQVDVSKPTVTTELSSTEDGGSGWGGSIDMESTYNRIVRIFNLAQKPTYVSSEIVTIDADGNVTTSTQTATSTLKEYYDEDVGSVTFSLFGSGNNENYDQYMYLFGAYEYTKTVNTTTYYYEDTVAYTISCDGYYLNFSGSAFSSSTDANAATKWLFSSGANGGLISTQIGNTYYYLRNNNGNLSYTTNESSATFWTFSDGRLYSTANNKNYYLTNENGSWKLVLPNSCLITDGTYYLNANGSTISSTTNAATATVWSFTAGSTGVYISYVSGTTTYYLTNDNGNLQLTSNTDNITSWTVTGNQISYDNYYLLYDNGWKLATINKYIISQNGNYLKINGSTISNTTNITDATQWTFSNGASGGYISATLNGTTYYLRNNGGGLSLTSDINNRTNWTKNGNYIYNGAFYLQYDNEWKLINKYYIYYGNNYLSVSGTNLANGTADTTVEWTFSYNTNGWYISTVINGRIYYLNVSSNWWETSASLTLSTYRNTLWSFNNNKLYCRVGNRTYYLSFQDGSWSVSRQQFTTYVTPAIKELSVLVSANTHVNVVLNIKTVTITDTIAQILKSRTETTTEVSYTTKETWLPLSADENNKVKLGNTGYIVSGTTYKYSNTYKSGDIRVSRYSMSDINVALNDNSYSGGRLEVVTRTVLPNGNDSGFVRISDNYNASNTNINNTLNNKFPTKTSVADLGLEKYNDSRDKLHNLFNGSSSIYGFHFMNATISMDRLVTANKVVINGETFFNYKMPCDSIDFKLKERGRINFFAGTYFDGNRNFFSLHNIIRNQNNDIVAIKQISKIYGNGDEGSDYIYLFSDGTYSVGSSVPNGYTMLFDTEWIGTGAEIVENAVYYFEIPVNAGEYALGSVTGGDGAYLMYLDISANRQVLDKTTIVEVVKTTVYSYHYPLGVAFVENKGDVIDDKNSVAVALDVTFGGTFTVSRNGNSIAFNTGQAMFAGDGVTDGGGNIIIPTEISSETSFYRRQTIKIYNRTTKLNSVTVAETRVSAAGERTFAIVEKTGDNAEDVTDDNNPIVAGETILTYRYHVPADGVVKNEYSLDVQVTSEITPEPTPATFTYQYAVTVTSNKNIKVRVVYATETAPITINGTPATANAVIDVTGDPNVTA